MVGVVNLVVLACGLLATTKKKVTNFLLEKVHPPKKVLATSMLLVAAVEYGRFIFYLCVDCCGLLQYIHIYIQIVSIS